jgi:hypothetical protein
MKQTKLAIYILLFSLRFHLTIAFLKSFSVTDTTMASFLVPSQAIRKSSTLSSKKTGEEDPAIFLVPSQVPASDRQSIASIPPASDEQLTQDSTSKSDTQKKKNRKKKNTSLKGKSGRKKKAYSTNTSSNGNNRPKRHGNIPDIEWRAIPMEHLRQHPNFVPLPLPETIDHLDDLEDVRKFRQESWQWDAVHDGRCTTSQAVAALGFLEPEAGRILGVPKSWQRGGTGAYHRLRRPVLRTLDEMNAVLCQEVKESSHSSPPATDNDTPIWMRVGESSTTSFPFSAEYMVPIDDGERQRRKKKMKDHYLKSPGFDFSIRMVWGNVQEATALLTGLNYFAQQSNNQVQLQEIGMCGAGIELENSTLLLGATPDALICHPDGRKEVLEVKNHCPFVPSRSRHNNNNRPQSRFSLRPCDFGKDNKAGILPQYVPQLMMEMLCVGPECQSAIMIRQSATSGTLVIRVQRDDAWIDEMVFWLKRFISDYVEREIPPPENFFLQNTGNDEDTLRYKRFLEWTKKLEAKVEKLAHVSHSKIQRATAPDITTDFFLD